MRKVKLTAIALCIIIIAGVLAGCGAAAIPKPTPAEGVTTIEITGSCDMKVDGSTITVSGETSFVKNTIINLSVVAQSGSVIDSTDVTQQEDGKVEATFQITDDKYDESVKAITGFITVSPSKQSDTATLEYGEKFERISSVVRKKDGENSSEIIWNKDGNIVTFESEPYELN